VAPDAAAAAVKKAIAANPNLGSYGIEPSVRDGRLVLTGRVRTGAEKDLAGFLAREASSLPLDNALEVRP
jgi:osmotically-inducible protein OsmY